MGYRVTRSSGIYAYEQALVRAGLTPVAGADEAGRGACAGPLVAAAVVLRPTKGGQITGLRDSKLMTEAARERAYDEIIAKALAWSCVIVEPGECDALGMHEANISALRRALLRLDVPPAYVITDGFPVAGLGTPGLAMWKGDRVAACVAAASVIAKVTRDRLMVAPAGRYPAYDFVTHKGYCPAGHQTLLELHGPCQIHRRRYENVRRAAEVAGSGSRDAAGARR